MRLAKSDLAAPGIRRRRSGKKFRYLDPTGRPVRDTETLRRVTVLVIPPAWREVWICPERDGHIQAVGIDDAGRRQYRYHEQWRRERDEEKHDRVLELATLLRDDVTVRRGVLMFRYLAKGGIERALRITDAELAAGDVVATRPIRYRSAFGVPRP